MALSPVLKSLVLALALTLGCSSTPTKRADTLHKEPITATSPEAQSSYDSALEALEQGRYETAAETFRLLQTEYPDDPIAEIAELYIARATVHDWEISRVRSALAIFSGLAKSESVDPRVRYASMVYEAISHALLGETQRAYETLQTYPGAELSPAVLRRDHHQAWPLLIESQSTVERHQRALSTAGAAWDSVATLEASSAVAQFARQRGFESADALSTGELNEILTATPYRLVRAAAGWTLFNRSNPEELSDSMLDTVVADLAAVGLLERAEDLRNRLDTLRPQGPVRIGVVLPLSGRHRSVGERALRGAMIAAKAFEKEGQGAPLVVVDANEPIETIVAKLSAADVLAVVGPLDLGRARTLATAATRKQLPILLLTTQMPPIDEPNSTGNTWVFRNFVDPESEARATAEAAFRQNADRRVALLYPDIGYGSRMATAFAERFEELGGEIVSRVEYPRKSSDYQRVASRIASENPDAIYIPDAAPKVAELTSFLAAENVWSIPHDAAKNPRSKRKEVHYLGTSLWKDPSLLQHAAKYVEGALIPAWTAQDFSNETTRHFAASYQRSYDSEPGDLETFTYDSVRIVFEASRLRGARDGRLLRDLLVAETFDGAAGRVTFGSDGEAKRAIRFVTVDDAGEFRATELEITPDVPKRVDPSL